MKSAAAVFATGLFIFAWTVAGASDPPELALPHQAAAAVSVENVAAGDGQVAGTLVNRTSDPVKNVRLLVQHTYRWPNEYKPGAVDPGRAETMTIDAEIPPGASYAFTQPSQPLQPPGDGGHFETKVSVLAFDRVIPAVTPPPPAAPASPAPAMP